MNGAVEQGVKTAYAVIEEYMLRGREAARRYQETLNQGGYMNSDPRSNPDWCAAWGPMGAWMAPWMQMTRLWMDCMRPFVPMPPDAGSCADPWAAPYGSASSRERGRPRLAVAVSSRRPTEVVVDLAAGADASDLDPSRLKHQNGQHWLDVPQIRCEEGQLRVRVTVPEDSPPGRYSGDLYDDRCIRRGGMTVMVHSEEDGGDQGSA